MHIDQISDRYHGWVNVLHVLLLITLKRLFLEHHELLCRLGERPAHVPEGRVLERRLLGEDVQPRVVRLVAVRQEVRGEAVVGGCGVANEAEARQKVRPGEDLC